MATHTSYVILNRRGYDITISRQVLKEIKDNNMNIGLVINSTGHSTVQLTKNNKYVCTLKSALGATGFKNGNNCDFKKSNLIFD